MNRRRDLIFFCLLLIAFLILLYGRALYESQAELKLGKEALSSNGKMTKAIPHLTKALRWRAPFNSAADEAQAIIERCAFNNMCKEQALSLEALQQGITASRSLWTLQSDMRIIDRIESEKIRIMGPARVTDLAPPKWRPGRQFLGQLALWGWIALTILFIWKGFTPQGEFKRGGLPIGILALTSLLLWLFILWTA